MKAGKPGAGPTSDSGAADAGRPDAIFDLAREAFQAGRFAEALRRWQQLLAARPDDASALTGMGATLQRIGQFDEARRCYQRAIDLEPANADAHCNMGSLQQGLGALEQALASYRTALRLNPEQPVAAAGVAAVLDWQGCYEEALEFVAPRVTRPSADPELVLIYARLLRRLDRHEEALELLLAALESGPPPGDRQRMHFVLGDLNDDLSRFDTAFEQYGAGNRLKNARFDPQAHSAEIDALIAFFTQEQLSALASSGLTSQRPVFIVGMPRSGTSLVEQILAAHSAVYAGGELAIIANMARGLQQFLNSSLPYPECLASVDQDSLSDLAKEYLRLAAPNNDSQRITDKLPLNFLHLGLIQMLFPRARVIHCRRNAIDTSLSCYFQNFGGARLPFSYDLEHIGRYYRDYRRVMKHYRASISLPILDVDYEQMVSRQEETSREIVSFLGLEWEDACLAFHKVRRTVVTASHAQVRKPIYTRSVNRHLHYAGHLGVLIDALGDAAES